VPGESVIYDRKYFKIFIFPRWQKQAGHGPDRGNSGDIEVFCFFSSEKKDFLALGIARPRGTHPGPPYSDERKVRQ
jgi:hypothetical protein